MELKVGAQQTANGFYFGPLVPATFITETCSQLIDLTDLVEQSVADSGVQSGVLHLFCPHTTCGFLMNENEDGLRDDLYRVLGELFPTEGYWAHDDLDRRTQNLTPDERRNGH